MKKNRTMKAAAVLLALTLMTSCFVGGTFAKYTSTVTGSDTARVAKWGVELSASTNLFAPEYNGDSGVSVLADDGEDVIAPGTEGTAIFFTIAGAPEVDVRVTATLNGAAGIADDYSIVTLPAGNGYKDWTVQTTGSETWDLAEDYQPVQWTLKKNGSAVVENKTLKEIEGYLTNTISKVYEVESGGMTGIVGDYTLSWTWPFEGNDKADTYLAQIAAGKQIAPGDGTTYCANERFALSLTVEQVN